MSLDYFHLRFKALGPAAAILNQQESPKVESARRAHRAQEDEYSSCDQGGVAVNA